MARPEGLEPPAYWFEASRSIHLSYGRAEALAPPHRSMAGPAAAYRAPSVASSAFVHAQMAFLSAAESFDAGCIGW